MSVISVMVPSSYRNNAVLVSKKKEGGHGILFNQLMSILTITETIYTVISLVVRIILAIYDYKQNKNNLDGRKPMVIFIYILKKVFK